MNQHASMNRIFRLVWNEAINAYVAAAETARGRRKRGKRKLIGAAMLLTAAVAHAGGPIGSPTGGQVIGGSGSINQAGGTTTITQASQSLSLNWQSFNIGAQQTVDFVQPNAAAIAVNRILGSSGSVILGHLNANGQVYLINPNGVLFGKGAEVNVGGLVASTLDVNESSLADGSRSFGGTGSGGGSVVNEGSLTAASGGSIALLGNRVSNTGVISAQMGSVALGAGSAATLKFSGTHLVSMQVDQSVLNSVASNGGLIRADGGAVLMTAGAQKALLASVVNNTGIIEARTLDNHEGTIRLLGGMSAGSVQVGGTLDASAPNGGNGGAIDTSAANVQVEAAAKVTTAAAMGLNGSWLIDPTDFTISAGSTAQSASGIGATTLQTELASGNVSIVTSSAGTQNGDIDVNALLSWSANALTLTAANNINVNAVMTVSGTAKVDFEPGTGALLMGFATDGTFAGRVDISSSAANALTIGGHVYTVINSLGAQNSTTGTDLQGMKGNLAGYYALGSTIDASATSTWGACGGCALGGGSGHYGFTPIGNSVNNFTGSFDGLGHTVGNLTVNNGLASNIGLFGWIGSTGTARNIGLVGLSSYAVSNVGALVGTNYGKISNDYSATGTVASGQFAGGLVGINHASGSVSNSYTTGTVNSELADGGVVAENFGTVTNDHSSATVGAGNSTGGLVGWNYGSVSNGYATGNVLGQFGTAVGGLVGTNTSTGTITNTYATGTTTGHSENSVGGLVGANAGAITQSHAIGAVSASGGYAKSGTGGFVGSNTGVISASYATGAVTATGTHPKNTGGLAGSNSGAISTSYATGSVSGYKNVGGLAGYGNLAGTISTSYASGNVTAANVSAGGLVGLLHGASGSISNSHATGNVTGGNYAGGLVGYNDSTATISNSYALGSVSGGRYTGGLVGWNYGAVSSSFATGPVTGTSNVGGLIGMNGTSGTVSDSYATGSVTGAVDVGGLLGANSGALTNGYATGSVTSSNYGGSLVGVSTGTVTNSFYNIAVNPSLTGIGADGGTIADVPGTVVGLTLAQLQTQANFTTATAANGNVDPGWNFGATWMLYEGHTAPLLQVFMTPLTVTGTVTQTYNGAVFAPSISNLTYSIVPDASHLSGAVTVVGTAVGAEHVGTYTFTPGGLSSDQLGYLISYNAGSLTISPAPVTVSGTMVGSKVYDGTTGATLSGGSLVGVFGGDTLTLIQAGSYASKNVGTGIAVSASDSIGGPSVADYILVDPTGLVGNITPALITVSGTTVGSKVYDGTTVALLSGGSLVGVIGGDSVALNQSGMFASSGAGTSIAVTATDSLSGASAGDYSIVEPTGLTASILPPAAAGGVPSNPPPAAATGAATGAPTVALNARTQIVDNFIYPQWGAEPQVISPSTTIAAAGTPFADFSADEAGSQRAIVINVSMTIGANGTLKIEDGGLRLPSGASGGQ